MSDPPRLARTIRRLAPDLGRVVQDLEVLETEGLALLLLIAPDAPVSVGVLGRSRVKVERLPGQRDFYRLKGLRRGPAKVYFGLHRGVFKKLGIDPGRLGHTSGWLNATPARLSGSLSVELR